MADSGAGSNTDEDGVQLLPTAGEIKSATTTVQNISGLARADDVLAIGTTPKDKMNIASMEKEGQGLADNEHIEVSDSVKNEVEIPGDQQARIFFWEEETSENNWAPLSPEVNDILEEKFKKNQNEEFDYEENDVRLIFNLANKTKVNQETPKKTHIRRVEKIQVDTTYLDERSIEALKPSEAKNQFSSLQSLDDTSRDSSAREKADEEVYNSPTIESFLVHGNGIWAVKIGGKMYSLPFVYTTEPNLRCFDGFQHISHQGVWFRLKWSGLGKLCLQNMQTKNDLALYEYSESLFGTDERSQNSIHGSPNECKEPLKSQMIADSSSTMVEVIRNSSADTDDKAGGETVMKTDIKAGKRPESNGGEADERDTEEKHNEETEYKSKTGASISLTLDVNISKTQVGNSDQSVRDFSGGETSNLSGEYTDTADEKDQSHTSNEEINQLQGSSMSFKPLGETEKTPKTETSVEGLHQMDGRETNRKNGDPDKIAGGKSVDTCDGNAGQMSGVENMAKHAHCLAENVLKKTESNPKYIDKTATGRMRRHQKSDEEESSPDFQEESTSKPPLEKKTPNSSKSAAEKSKQLDWRCSEGNPHVINLLIKYLKKQEKDTHSDFFTHELSCSINFQLMWNFFTQTECGKEMLDAIVAIYHCQVSLPADDHLKEIFIFQVSDAQFHEKSDVRGFVDGVIDSVYKCAQESLFIDSFNVDPRMEQDFQERLKQKKELDCAWIKFVGEGNPITVFSVCHKENQQCLVQVIKEVLVDAEDSFHNHEEIVAVDFIHQTLLNKFGYLKEMGDKFPVTKVNQNEDTNAFLLKGPRDEVKAAAGHLKKLLKKACEEVPEELLSLDCQFEIFTYPEMCDYVDNLIKELSAAWIPNQLTKKIHIFSRKHSQLIAKAIKGCVQERLYPVSKDHSRHISEKVELVRKELNEKYRGKFVLHQSDAGLQVTAADDISGSVNHAIQEIIGQERDNANYAYGPDKHVDREGQMSRKNEPDTTDVNQETQCLFSEKNMAPEKVIARTIEVKDKNVFRKIMEKDLSEFEQMAREHGITICKRETQNRLGFKLEGLEKEVECMSRNLEERIRSEEQQIYLLKDVNLAGETENLDDKTNSVLVDVDDHYAHDPDEHVERDGQMSSKTEPDMTDVKQKTKCLICEKDIAPENTITRTIEVKDKNVFRKILEKDLSEYEQMAKEHDITIHKRETQNRLGFKLEGSEKEVACMSRNLEERIRSEEQQIYLQKDVNLADIRTVGSVGLFPVASENFASQAADQDEYSQNMDRIWQLVLNKFGYFSKIVDMYPGVTLVLNETTDLCIIKGPKKDISTVVNYVKEMLHTAQSSIAQIKFCPCDQFEILTYPEMEQYIERAIAVEMNQTKYAWFRNFQAHEVYVFTESKENCERIEMIIKGCIREERVQLPAQIGYEQKTKLVERSFASHEGKFCIKHDNGSIFCLTAAVDIFDSVKNELQVSVTKYFSLEKSTEKYMGDRTFTDPSGTSEDRVSSMVLQIENGSVYRRMLKVEKWIKEMGNEHTVEVRQLSEPQKVGFVLEGPSDRVKEMADYMKNVQKDIITQKYSAFSPSEVSYLVSVMGRQILARLEEENSCAIEITNPAKVSGAEENLPHGGTFGSDMMVTFIYAHNQSVILFNGKVESLKTDVIVTPVMTPFSSTGPQKSQFFVTQSPTRLNMFVPLCSENNPKAKTALIDSICATLHYTEDNKYGKVGFSIKPIGGWDLIKFVKRFLYTISTVFSENQDTNRRKVYLCTTEVDIFARMKAGAIDYFQPFITGHNKAGDTYTVKVDAAPGKEPQAHPSNSGLHFDKIEVRVEAGELSQVEADVIVNTTSSDLDLNIGATSKSLLMAAGQEIQDECKKVYPKGIHEGEVARTSGGKMKCKQIFHGALKKYSDKNWSKILKKFVDTCLTEAIASGYKSIAFPALGTGNLGLPKEHVAHTMFNCVKEFSYRKPVTLRKVTFVIYRDDKNTFKIFQDFILKFKATDEGKTESSDFEIEVTGLKDKVSDVIKSIQKELKLTSEHHQAEEKNVNENMGAVPSTITEPLPQGSMPEKNVANGEETALEQANSGASMNMVSMDYSEEEKCCVVVSGKMKSKEELERDIFNYERKPKHIVYPYDERKQTALIIFESEQDACQFMRRYGTSFPHELQRLEPQFLQKCEITVEKSVVRRASDFGQLHALVEEIKERSGVKVITDGNQMCLQGITANQMKIALSCLEEFCEVKLQIKLRRSLSSLSPNDGILVHMINGVSETEHAALKILNDDFREINAQKIHLAWKDGAILITAESKSIAKTIQTLNIQLEELRSRQTEEVILDENCKKVVRDVIAEMQSKEKDTICVYDEEKSQVVIYSDKQGDIMKFKHKLKFKSGQVKGTARSKERFAENTQLMEGSQGNLCSSVMSTEIRHTFSWSKDASDLEVFYTKENVKVAVYKADILNLPVDCIVNAANDNLQHGGGVAQVIAEAAGPDLIQEGNEIIKKKGQIPVGCQVTTTAGKLPYKRVIHTVGPRWSDYQPYNLQKVQQCQEDLYAAIYGCFLEAEKCGLSTIALPAVSSGIYSVPQHMCAVQYARAVIDYCNKSIKGKSLTEIHFIDRIPHLVKLIQDTFRIMIQTGKDPNYNIQNYVTFTSSYQRQQSKNTGRKGHNEGGKAGNMSQYETTKLKTLTAVLYDLQEHNKVHSVFHISVKPVVHIYDGDILKLTNMDAIVCSVGTRGSPIGIVASELGKKHSYKQQKDKCFKIEKPVIGDVVITFGEGTSFELIVHVVIETNFDKKPEFNSTMKRAMNNILRKTNEFVKVKRMALPLFGVKYERLEKVWAELFLESFVDFCSRVKNPNLEEVHIITHSSSSSAYSTVKKVFHDFTEKINRAQHQELVPSPSIDTKDHMPNRGNETKDDEGDADDSCTICMCAKTDPKTLSCGHSFCSECIDQMFKHKPVCPVCGKIVGTLTGDQPKNGKMEVMTFKTDLAGYEGHGSIMITYDFPAGIQQPNHPSPGTLYPRMMRIAYLPNTSEGRTVCRMLQLAFERRLVFTISQSHTTGKEGLTWNDIHHKTNTKPGAQFGYPDPEYLSRVKDELAAKGITEADLPPEKTGLVEFPLYF